MNIIWLFILISSMAAIIFVSPTQALETMLGASVDAVDMTLKMLAIYAVWLGLLNILEKTGFNKALEKLLRPLIRLLFKNTTEQTNSYIAMNFSANMLGLGSIATTMGINAIASMDDNSGIATDNMLMFLIINATSLQLFPTTVIALRTAAGSANPSDIILPSILASSLTTLLGIMLVFAARKITKIPFVRNTKKRGVNG